MRHPTHRVSRHGQVARGSMPLETSRRAPSIASTEVGFMLGRIIACLVRDAGMPPRYGERIRVLV